MRHWLLTSTTYGTWLPGDTRGSVTSVRERRASDVPGCNRIEHRRPGEAYEPPMLALRRSAMTRLRAEPVWLIQSHAEELVLQFRETATHRGWTLLAASVMANHFHLVVRVLNDPEPQRVLADFKAYGSRALNRRFGEPRSGDWWTSGGSKRKLPDEAAVVGAVNYVLNRQQNPLIAWSPNE
jgi:REP element-mobilizing transposase RayT